MSDTDVDEADRLEALSTYQALSIPLLLLESGKWAIIHGERKVEITPCLDEGWMRSTAQAAREAYDARRAAARVAMTVDKTEKTMEDLGL